MKLVIQVLNEKNLLDDLLHELGVNGIKGATILDSTGMGRILAKNDDMDFIGSLKTLYLNPREESHVILMVLEDELVDVAYSTIKKVCGNLNKPHSGIVFTIPIEDVYGYGYLEETK